MNQKLTRRVFLGKTAPAVLGAGWLAGQARWLRAAAPGASERMRLGIIGCGGRAQGLLGSFQRVPNVDVAAICDVNERRLDVFSRLTEGKATRYGDYRKLLEDTSIDAVLVATNGHWHVLPAIAAVAAGKHVYLEKPVGTSIGEGRAAITASRKHNRIIQMGTQQRSWGHYQKAVKLIQSGALGDVYHVHVWDLENWYPGFGRPDDCDPPEGLNWDFWVGPSPKVPFNPNRLAHHYWFFDYGGGWQLDWAVHHYDIVNWAMGARAPIAAVAAGGKYAFDDNTQWPSTFDGVCEYGPCPAAKRGFQMAYTYRGASSHAIEGRKHGKAFYGTNGTLVLDRGSCTIFGESRDGKKVIEDQQITSEHEGDATATHVKAFVESVCSGAPHNSDIQAGHDASTPGHLMNIAWRTGRRIRWDADAEKVIDDPEANAMVLKRYRPPWSLPA